MAVLESPTQPCRRMTFTATSSTLSFNPLYTSPQPPLPNTHSWPSGFLHISTSLGRSSQSYRSLGREEGEEEEDKEEEEEEEEEEPECEEAAPLLPLFWEAICK